ncbi:PQQ-dependent sugar dehydrogenase [Seonamhaeicola sp.]|uniref:PQQ-dependent sugar dehydrogenase n=1 Tax=Seonamhaeicola sp. TaxID=1912245 RepID=UPI002633611B|nr:PQQ-dependent sugar dehydrogenase [Seonamhaeicola sp.]
MKNLNKFKFIFRSLLFLAIVFSCSNQTETTQNDDTQEEEEEEVVTDFAQAAINYTNHCGGCHGQKFESFIERQWSYGSTSEDISNSISVGYESNGMPSYKNAFTDQEIKDLADYILREIEGKTKADIEAENPNLSGIMQSDDLSFRLETITNQFSGIPWGMVQLPDGDFLVTQREGNLFRVTSDGTISEISGIPNVVAQGQGGLLDVILHPDFENNAYVYLSYSSANPSNSSQKTTAVARGSLSGNTLEGTNEIFVAEPYLSNTNHYGSRLVFDNGGYLYVTVGDRGNRDTYPQTLNNGVGKIHRLMDNGTIPTDNPFYNMQNHDWSVFGYGVRNPQGLAKHPVTGAIWEGEHGPQGGDEINIVSSGNNYGWPVITYGINYDGTPITNQTAMDGMEQPIHYWVPSIAPCGMDFVSSNFYGNWQNDLFVGSLKFRYLHRLKMNGNTVIGQEELLSDIGRVRDVQMGNDGYLYILVEGPGRLLRLVAEQ